MTADDIITIGVIVRELEKEGVGTIQATRIGKAVAAALGVLHGSHAATD
jgi:hypothetical protein